MNHIESVKAARQLLIDVIANPGAFGNQQDLERALATQVALAKYHNESRGIHGASLNTIKQAAKRALDGGFEAFERLRANAKEALARHAQDDGLCTDVTKVGLAQRVDDLKSELCMVRQDLLLITWGFDTSVRQARHYAQQASGTVIALCEREQRELLQMLSLRQRPIALKQVAQWLQGINSII